MHLRLDSHWTKISVLHGDKTDTHKNLLRSINGWKEYCYSQLHIWIHLISAFNFKCYLRCTLINDLRNIVSSTLWRHIGMVDFVIMWTNSSTQEKARLLITRKTSLSCLSICQTVCNPITRENMFIVRNVTCVTLKRRRLSSADTHVLTPWMTPVCAVARSCPSLSASCCRTAHSWCCGCSSSSGMMCSATPTYSSRQRTRWY